MSDLYWLTDEQMARLRPYFPKSRGKPRVDDKRVLSASGSSIATGYDGGMHRRSMARTRHCTTVGSAGVRWAEPATVHWPDIS